MGPSYDEENNALLDSLLKYKADAPEDWPTYPIEVKSEAGMTYLQYNTLQKISYKILYDTFISFEVTQAFLFFLT